MTQSSLHIRFAWDPEAEGWYVAESDVPGLNAEADTVDELAAKVRVMAPELLVLNRHLLKDVGEGDIALHWTAERDDTVHLEY